MSIDGHSVVKLTYSRPTGDAEWYDPSVSREILIIFSSRISLSGNHDGKWQIGHYHDSTKGT